MGRDISFLREISQRSGLPIVAGGGFYTQPFYPKEISTMSEEQIVQALIRQVETEPSACSARSARGTMMTADERKVFRAIGKAHVATNLPIFTHTGIPGKRRSSSSISSRMPASSRIASSSATSET